MESPNLCKTIPQHLDLTYEPNCVAVRYEKGCDGFSSADMA